MEKEYKLWLELFKGILEENSYYENMQKIIKKDKNFSIASLVDDYLDNATFISVSYYLFLWFVVMFLLFCMQK